MTRLLAILSMSLVLPDARGAEEPVPSKIDYTNHIRPILAEHCFKCHGPDEKTRRGGLRLDFRANALAQLDSGMHAIVPEKPEASELVARIDEKDPSFVMPPKAAKKTLSDAQKVLLREWIRQGAPYEQHWAFVKPQKPNYPRLKNPAWVRDPLDAFVLARLEGEGLAPSPEADRAIWIRRVSLDLTGLPPTLAEVDDFLGDNNPDAREKVVDRLLASPAFGERWGRVWLDLARYADSAGYAQDPPRTIWKYRDWVIRAINDNLTFDQFTIRQLAGDMLPDPREEHLLATAFHRNTMTNSEGGTNDEEFRVAAIVDRVNTTMSVWMGLTMSCAQCHSHKYDPISQEEYFRFYAILNNTEDADRGDESPNLVTYTPQEEARRQELQERIARLEEANKKKPDAEAKKELDALKKQLGEIKGVATPIFRELPPDRRRKTRIQERGNFLVEGKEVTPGVPEIFPQPPSGVELNRLTLAKWLVSPENPLTARVTVNRYWEHLFGTGLVETSEDFGTQGEPPSHPDLLDHLAVEFVRTGWDVKRLLRSIVLSATYRQSSRVTPDLVRRDPDNRLLTRGPRFRLDAEQVRDQALFLGGLLSNKMFGPSVQPPRPNLGLRSAFGGSTDWTTSAGQDKFRRGLYTSWRRTTPYPSMTTFDAPSREVCTIRRIRTNTPLQALVTLNDPVYVEASQALGRRMIVEGGKSPRDRVIHGFRLCLSRTPDSHEVDRLVALHEQVADSLRGSPEDARQLATQPLGPVPEGMDVVEAAAWTVVGNVLLNLDELLARP